MEVYWILLGLFIGLAWRIAAVFFMLGVVCVVHFYIMPSGRKDRKEMIEEKKRMKKLLFD